MVHSPAMLPLTFPAGPSQLNNALKEREGCETATVHTSACVCLIIGDFECQCEIVTNPALQLKIIKQHLSFCFKSKQCPKAIFSQKHFTENKQ